MALPPKFAGQMVATAGLEVKHTLEICKSQIFVARLLSPTPFTLLHLLTMCYPTRPRLCLPFLRQDVPHPRLLHPPPPAPKIHGTRRPSYLPPADPALA